MVTKPTASPSWGTGDGASTEPADDKKAAGFLENEKPPFQYFNWVLKNHGDWISWLNSIAQNKNWLINGNALINQRVASVALIKDIYVFGPDRFAAMATGSAVSAGTIEQITTSPLSKTGTAFYLAGVTLTGTGILYLRTRVSAKDAINLQNQYASFSCKVFHDYGLDNVPYTIYIRKPTTTADDFSAVTEISNSGAILVNGATVTALKYENIAMGDCSKGIEIEIKIGCGAITANNFELSELQLEIGESASSFQYLSFEEQLRKCRAYYEKCQDYSKVPGSSSSPYYLFPSVATDADKTVVVSIVPKVKTPTVTIYKTDGSGEFTSGSKGPGENYFYFSIQHTETNYTEVGILWVADSEL